MKRVLSGVLVMLMMVCCVPFPSAEAVSTSASSAVLMSFDSGEMLYAQNPHEKRAIASITKIMTAVVALEQPEDKLVTFQPSMIAEGTSMYLKVGEVLSLSELTKGMMMVSGNDAANAIALSVAGSKEKFADLMNQKAQQIGMKDSHFVTPSGLDDEEHYSTAYDMALLCRYAMRNPKFRAIVSQKSIEVQYTSPKNKTQTCTNHNRLISMCDGCMGIKTGYTSKAGRTLTSAVERNGVMLIAVTLNDRNDWNDHKALYDYGFSCVEKVDLTAQNTGYEVPVVGAKEQSIVAVPKNDCEVALIQGSRENIQEKINLPRFVYAPIRQGEILGTMDYYLGSRCIAHTRLIAQKEITYDTES